MLQAKNHRKHVRFMFNTLTRIIAADWRCLKYESNVFVFLRSAGLQMHSFMAMANTIKVQSALSIFNIYHRHKWMHESGTWKIWGHEKAWVKGPRCSVQPIFEAILFALFEFVHSNEVWLKPVTLCVPLGFVDFSPKTYSCEYYLICCKCFSAYSKAAYRQPVACTWCASHVFLMYLFWMMNYFAKPFTMSWWQHKSPNSSRHQHASHHRVFYAYSGISGIHITHSQHSRSNLAIQQAFQPITASLNM